MPQTRANQQDMPAPGQELPPPPAIQGVHQAIVHNTQTGDIIEQESHEGADDIQTLPLPPAKPATRGRKKKETQPPAAKVPRVTPPARAGATKAKADDTLSNQIGEILQLLKAQAARPQIIEPQPRAIANSQPAIDLFQGARAALESRLPTVEGTINIEEYLTRKSQRRVKENSIDIISFNEFVYAFIGHLLETPGLDATYSSKLQFLRHIAEDSEGYQWAGVLDWALTTLERVNTNSTSWSAAQDRAMDRLVISRSVSNAMQLTSIPCVEYNQGNCRLKSAHQEGRFNLEHVCTYCFAIGIEHPHTDRSCHRKKQVNNGQSKQNHSASHRSEYRHRNHRESDNRYDQRSDSKN